MWLNFKTVLGYAIFQYMYQLQKTEINRMNIFAKHIKKLLIRKKQRGNIIKQRSSFNIKIYIKIYLY